MASKCRMVPFPCTRSIVRERPASLLGSSSSFLLLQPQSAGVSFLSFWLSIVLIESGAVVEYFLSPTQLHLSSQLADFVLS